MRIGIRLEDKNEWERRVPLSPDDVADLIRNHGTGIAVQSSEQRVFADEAYQKAGAEIRESLSESPVILGVKEMPPDSFESGKTYLFFSHTIKGQPYNMAMLRRLRELKCNLLDYEKIEDDQGRRLVFFGKYAGLAGMIDGLWMLGRRLKAEGHETPFLKIIQALRYAELKDAKAAVVTAGEEIAAGGLSADIGPFVVGFAGYGNVSRGAQEIFDLLPHRVVAPEDLASAFEAGVGDGPALWKVVFEERHMAEPDEGGAAFDLQEYYDHPQRYRGIFHRHLPYLSMLVNCIFWTTDYPRLATIDQVRALYSGGNRRLRAVVDITCDPRGSVQCTTHCTDPGNPWYTFDCDRGQPVEETTAAGPAILAVDNLPCELPADASTYFSRVLKEFVPPLATCDFGVDYPDLSLPDPLKRALILHRGEFTPPFAYMQDFLKS